MPPTVNGDAILAGCIYSILLSPWVANYGATVFTDLGAAKGCKLPESLDSQDIRADNVQFPLGANDTEAAAGLKVNLLQYDPTIKMYMWGKPLTDISTVAHAAGPPIVPASLSWGIGDLPKRSYFTVKCVVDNLEAYFDLDGAANQKYTYYCRTFAKCRVKIKSELDLGLKVIGEVALELDAFYDASVTTSGAPYSPTVAGKDRLFRETFRETAP